MAKPKAITFTKAKPVEFEESFMRYSTPCGAKGIGASDAETNLAFGDNYISWTLFDKFDIVEVDMDKYGRQVALKLMVDIHGFIFSIEFGVDELEEPNYSSIVFGRKFLVDTKCNLDFELGEMKLDLGMLEDDKELDWLLGCLVEEDFIDVSEGAGAYGCILDTPLVPPFLDSDDDSDDGEVLNELEEYGNAWKLCRKKRNLYNWRGETAVSGSYEELCRAVQCGESKGVARVGSGVYELSPT
ncbi:hypothetical protein Tco_0256413 [Tanacetum coccineum]